MARGSELSDMPTYEYECLSCEVRFEVEQRISAMALTECPRCHGLIRRLISGGGGFIVKSPGGGAGAHAHDGSECSLTRTGRTCCGRAEKCGEAPCDSGE